MMNSGQLCLSVLHYLVTSETLEIDSTPKTLMGDFVSVVYKWTPEFLVITDVVLGAPG